MHIVFSFADAAEFPQLVSSTDEGEKNLPFTKIGDKIFFEQINVGIKMKIKNVTGLQTSVSYGSLSPFGEDM